MHFTSNNLVDEIEKVILFVIVALGSACNRLIGSYSHFGYDSRKMNFLVYFNSNPMISQPFPSNGILVTLTLV